MVELLDCTPAEGTPMTDDRLPLAELMAKADDGDFLRSVAESVLQILMEADVEGMIGAARYERSGERATYRNGYRDRGLDTRLGTLNLKIPKLRTGSYFPGFLEPRRTVEKALVAVIQEAWIAGVSTRRVDDLVQAMGLSGISKSSVSKLCKDIDERVNSFLQRQLTGEWPYLWLDATYLKVREGGRIVSVAVIVAVAVTTEGRREIVGLHIGPSEAEIFWTDFLRDLVKRGLTGIKLVISDAHEGLKAAVTRVLSATWQRCRVHTIRTQSSNGVSSALTSRRRAAQGNDMTDLQAAVVNDDAVDDQLQESLPVLKRGIVQPDLNPLAERPQIGHHRLSLAPLVAQATLLLELKIQGMTLVGQLPAAVLQFLQADHFRLVSIQQAPVAPRQPIQTGPKLALGLRSTRRSLTRFIGKRLELGKQPIRIAEKATDMVPHRSLQVISLDVSP
jgi:hypothetical protein